MAKKKPKILVDESRGGRWVRVWKENRDFIVQIWNVGWISGEPNGDWQMPGRLGIETAIAQALAQTK